MKLSKIALIAAGLSALSTPPVLAQTSAPSQIETTAKKFCVVIDAGHGGTDTGLNTGVIPEKDVDLALALKLRSELEKRGVQIVMTRTKDETMTLAERAAFTNKVHPDYFITIHNDDDKQKETALISYYGSPSRRLAFYSQIFLSVGLSNVPSSQKGHLRAIESPYFLLRKSTAPAIMVTANRKMFLVPQQQQKFAFVLANAIKFYSELKNSPDATPTEKSSEVPNNTPERVEHKSST